MIDSADTSARLDHWKQQLLALCAPLLDLDATTTIPLPAPDAVRIAFALASGRVFAIEASDDARDADPAKSFEVGRLRPTLTASELSRRLAALARRVSAANIDSGAHALYLGLGALIWRDATGTPRRAPVWLLPVELERSPGGSVRLAATKWSATVNHALADMLERDCGLVVDRALDVSALLEVLTAAAMTRPGWSVERGADLAAVSLAPFALWQELSAHGALFAHPLAARLASAGGEPAAAIALPDVSTAGLVAPLDADATQLAAIATVCAGTSIALDAAPGTGATQTIANLVAHAASRGSSILVISDRRAALAAVRERLASVGLADICLDLHAPPADIFAQLERALARSARPGAGPNVLDGRLGELAAGLDAYAHALHARGLLGRSLHDVIGRLVELRTTANAALAEADAESLTGALYDRRLAAIRALAAAAVPVEPVASHPWRQAVADAAGVEPAELVARAGAALADAAAASEQLTAALGELALVVPGVIARTPAQLEAIGALATVAARSERPGAELVSQIRGGFGDELTEQLALVRARGGGAIDIPRDPAAFVAVAIRQRALAHELAAHVGRGPEVADTSEISDDARIADVQEALDALDAPELWLQLKRWSGRVAPLRFMALRTARAEIASALRAAHAAAPDADRSIGELLELLELAIAERACRRALAQASEPARRWFGELASDPMALDLPRIDAAVSWAAELRRAFDALSLLGGDAGRQSAWRALVAQVAAGPGQVGGASEQVAFARLAAAVARWQAALVAIADATGVPHDSIAPGADDHLAAARDQIDTWRQAASSLPAWLAFAAAHRAAACAGIGPALAALERADLGAAELADAWERATLLAWSDAEVARVPALAEFHGPSQHAQVAAFADLDRGSLALARARALVKIGERVPRIARATRSTGDADLDGEIAALRARTAAFAAPADARLAGADGSLRAALAALPTLLPRLAPCVLASPAEAAEHLEAQRRFDIVVVDEAAQLPAIYGLAAIARADAALVIGDPERLAPPAGPSLFAAAVAAGWPTLQLSTHYRSRCEQVIAAANASVYRDRLAVCPAPAPSSELGVGWRVAAGDTAEQAAVIAGEVIARLRDPAQRARSIAVIALARELATAIEDGLSAARAADRELDAVFEQLAEPVLVHHVDAAQGSERDVAIVACGGQASLAAATARQLAVALTCAREQVWVFAPVDELPAGAAPVLAATRELARGERGERTGAANPPASPITAAIARALGERGWTLHHRVGAGAYRIDLAVVDPTAAAGEPVRYVLAIECDGEAYASAPAARDRDRLRGQLLAQLGWRVHRVWSMDWWLDPEAEVARAHGAIIAAVAACRQRRAPAPARARGPRTTLPGAMIATGSAPIAASAAIAATQPAPAQALAKGSGRATIPALPTLPMLAADSAAVPAAIVAGDATESTNATGAPVLELDARSTAPLSLPRGAIAIGPYIAATIPAGRRVPDDLFAPRHERELGKIVEQVLAAEAPMHIDVLARRVGAYFGIGRISQRVVEQVRSAIAGHGVWGGEPGIVWRADQDPSAIPAVRVAAGVTAPRAIAQVPLAELAAAARIVVERATGIASAELVRDAARLLGFARVTAEVSDRVAQGVQLAQLRELIAIDDAGKARIRN